MTKTALDIPSKESLKRHYDDRYAGDYMDADAYATWAHEGLAEYRVRQTLEQVGNDPRRILDYGCGQGKWTSVLRRTYPNAEIVGIDISETAIAKASEKFPQDRFLVFDGNRAALEDGSFDLVFSFHVLEHVLDVTATVRDIARLLRPGAYACIIFPCGNKNSFEDRVVNLMQDGRRISATGESVFFFEVADGHLRRMPSAQTIALFAQEGLAIQTEFYSGQLFAAVDWLVRGTGPAHINRFFDSGRPASRVAAIRLATMRRFFLFLHRFLSYRNLDTTKPRPLPKQIAVSALQKAAAHADRFIVRRARREWDARRHAKHGSAQYLVFRKTVQ